MKNKIIGVLGANGSVGKEVIQQLKKAGFYIRAGYRNKESIDEKQDFLGDEIHYFHINNKELLEKFCIGASVIVNTVGPSTLLSQLVYETANKVGVAFVDPSGSHLAYNQDLVEKNKIPCILAAGLFPGLSGIIIENELGNINNMCESLEISIGGRYIFSKAAALDFMNESKITQGGGVIMASFREGKVSPALKMKPDFIPRVVENFKTFPYLSEEVIRIAINNNVGNAASYNIADETVYKILSRIPINADDLVSAYQGKNIEQFFIIAIDILSSGNRKKVLIEGEKPSETTGIMTALAIEYIIENNLKPRCYFFSDIVDPKVFLEKFSNRLNIKCKVC